MSTSGAAFCWGNNSYGQLGDGSNARRLHPVRVSGGNFRQVSTGTFHSCGIGEDGQAYCWGGNTAGQVGDGSTDDRRLPTAVRGARSWIDIDAGLLHTCGVTTTNEAYCWGFNDQGQLGIGTKGFSQTRVVPKLVLGREVLQVGGPGWGVQLRPRRPRGRVVLGRQHRRSAGRRHHQRAAHPVAVMGNKKWDLLAAGYDQTCGVARTGRVVLGGQSVG